MPLDYPGPHDIVRQHGVLREAVAPLAQLARNLHSEQQLEAIIELAMVMGIHAGERWATIRLDADLKMARRMGITYEKLRELSNTP